MRFPLWLTFAALVVSLASMLVLADVTVAVDRNVGDAANERFHFKTVRQPVQKGVARCDITVVDGKPDDNCGRAAVYLGKAKLPEGPDDPKHNFFFADGDDGGRLRVDLGSAVPVVQLNTYSWHPAGRGPQVYTLYGADGTAAGFDAAPKKGTDPTTCGWKRIAAVDTRTAGPAPVGGQYGVSVSDPAGPIGVLRYLLLDVVRAEASNTGNTFYSKIDVFTAGPETAPAK